jgi:hypothetical protein
VAAAAAGVAVVDVTDAVAGAAWLLEGQMRICFQIFLVLLLLLFSLLIGR